MSLVLLHAELALRICAGTLFGSVIGYERDIHGRPAGLRTHAVVGLASSTFMVVSTRFVYFQHYTAGDLVSVDTSRIAASVVTGIGFLAGGAILRSGITVQGLTTAAGLWLVAAIGLASGGGMYVEGMLATAIGIAALTLLRRFEDKHDQRVARRLSLDMGAGAPPIGKVMEDLTALGAIVTEEHVERDFASATWSVTFDVRLPVQLTAEQLLAAMERYGGIQRVRFEALG
jgi:putative Mg2+ transporter-C (MgtC) family protein